MSTYKIKDIPIPDRPREKLKALGPGLLTDVELLSIIIKTGLRNKNVKELALEILNNYSIFELKSISLEELTRIKGIGEVKAIELLASIELGKRITLKQENKKKLDSPEQIWHDAKYLFYEKKQEYFYCYYFDNRNNLLTKKLIYIGTINSSVTHTREIFKEAYRISASSIVCIHNHPSGDVTPSRADIDFTEHLIKTGNIQGIPVIDHLIVGDNSFYSFYENKKLNV